jgi:hypothetical protein
VGRVAAAYGKTLCNALPAYERLFAATASGVPVTAKTLMSFWGLTPISS